MLNTESYVNASEKAYSLLNSLHSLPQKRVKGIKSVLKILASINGNTSIGICDDRIMDCINSLVEMTFVISYEPRMKVQKALQYLWEVHYEYLRVYKNSGY